MIDKPPAYEDESQVDPSRNNEASGDAAQNSESVNSDEPRRMGEESGSAPETGEFTGDETTDVVIVSSTNISNEERS